MMLYFGVLYIGDIFINKTGYNKEPQKLPNPRFGVKVKVKSLSRVQLFPTPWTVAYQAPPPMGFSRQEYWSGVPLIAVAKLATWADRFPSGALYFKVLIAASTPKP